MTIPRHRAFQRIVGRAFFGLCLLGPISVMATEVEMEINPRTLRLGESTTCKIILRDAQGAPPPRLPAMSGFEITPVGTEQSFQIENGRQSSRIAYNFQLTPLAAGDFQIGPFRYDTGHEVIDIPAIQIQVVAQDNTADAARAQQWDELIFASLSVDRPAIYAQEVFDLTLNLHIQPGLNIDRNVGLLDFDTTGLSLNGFEEIASTRETVDGKIYDVRHFRTRATALTSGTFNLQPRLRVNLIVASDRSRRRDPFFGDSFFDNFFNRVETRPQTVESHPLALQIRDLPGEGRPSSFSGAVGNYSFEASANPTQARVGDPITLTLRIQGRGNMDAISAPSINIPDGFRSYDARLVEQRPEAGLKVFEQVLIPRNPSISEIPAVSFSYFDPERQRYETIVRGPFPLQLTAAPAGSTAIAQTGSTPAPASSAPLGNDLVYLKTAPKQWRHLQEASAKQPSVSVAINLLPALALIAVFGYVRRREHHQRNPHEVLRRRAPKEARTGLSRSRELARTGNIQGAAQALSEALEQFYGPLLNLPPGRISAEEVCRQLQVRGLPTAQCVALQEVFSVCDRLRYSGPSAAIGSENAASELERITNQLGDLLRASRKVVR